MSFAYPGWLWLAALLPALVGAAILAHARRRRRVAAALGGVSMAGRLGAAGLARFSPPRAALLILAAALTGFAAAGPQWGYSPAESRTRALSLVLAMDASNSMLATDIEPNRLEREKLLASRLLRELAGDRIGLVVFAGQGYVLAPLTVDHSALQLYIDALDPTVVSAGGTAISSGLRQATDLVRGDPSGGDRTVILLTDGEALEEEALVIEAAERAASLGVVVHTVGVGTEAGSRVPDLRAGPGGVTLEGIDPVTGRPRAFIRDVDGSIVVSKLNEPLLRRVAEITRGVYVRLGEAGATERLLAAVAELERAPTDATGRRLEPKNRSGWFIAAALLLLAIEVVLADRERVRGGSGPRWRRLSQPDREAARV